MNDKTCSECRFYLPGTKTHYNKPCGYCGNFRMPKPRVSDDEACRLFELDEKAQRKKPP